ncbi:hypothetical protein GCM10007383_01480 [Arenibacter certesii]|uniref:Capsule assembly Wzi family protein n=2 Tax=Arenibacter certesii TaxID=228955 RepID=A0A918MHI8_9FLAO|nr:hypothetical protein GCM10007383_01480 [Arenibacter certesii]
MLHAQSHFITEVSLKGLQPEGKNTFWTHSNTNALISPTTRFLGTISSEYAKQMGNYGRLTLGGSAFYTVNHEHPNIAAFNQYYGEYQFRKVSLTLGAKQRPEKQMGLSSVGGDIIWSNNARAIPGLELTTATPIKISNVLSLDATLGHYLQNDDRYVQNARVHYKQVTFNFNTSQNSVLSVGIHNYAQWGGISTSIGKQPDSFKDYLRVVFGHSGTSEASVNDQINALGNHLGSYHVEYKYQFKNKDKLHLYYQSIFEDTSGRELENFPDGVWGVFWSSPKNSFIKGLLYEYQHTLSQSGLSPIRGGDNYFSNSIYRSGWTYFGEAIGTPFITPNPNGIGIINNTYRAHHVGATGRMFNLYYKGKASYVENMGRHRTRWNPTHKNLYVYGDLTYFTSPRSSFTFILSGDIYSATRDRLTVGFGYKYRFVKLYPQFE